MSTPNPRTGRTPDVVAFAVGSLCAALGGLVLWSAYGGPLDRGTLGVAIPVLLVLVGAGCQLLRSRSQ